MFLKHRDGWNIVCAALAALCIAAGLTMNGRGIDVLNRGEAEPSIAETGFSFGITSELEEEISWTQAEWSTEENIWSEREWTDEQEEIWETEFYDSAAAEEMVRNTEEIVQAPEPSQSIPFAGNSAMREIAVIGLLLAGAVLTGMALFWGMPARPLSGPEAELFLLYGTVISGMEVTAVWLFFILQFIRLFGILLCLRGLWCWCRKHFSADWTVSYRLGMRWQRATGKWSRYQLVQYLVGILAVSGIMFLCVSYRYTEAMIHTIEVNGMVFFRIREMAPHIWILAALLLFCAGLALRNQLRMGAGGDHLLRQISALYEGGRVEPATGMYEEAEQQLAALSVRQAEAVQTAVTSERFKVELISNVSHDLRTPLTSILGYGELLEKEKLSQEGIEHLQRLNTKAGYMKELVDSLFELTKVSSGVIPVNWQQIDLIRLLEQTIGLFDDQLTQAGLQVKRHYGADEMLLVTDGARLHQVFANLLGNAIKYALTGTRIHLEVTERAESCIVRMTNISSYEMDFEPEEIMQRFARGDKVRTTRGSGLGLAIAQTYTESVGGKFRIMIDGDSFSAVVELPQRREELQN